MLSAEQRESFGRDGFLIVPGLLTPEQVSWLRAYFRPVFERRGDRRFKGDTEHVLFDVFARHSEARWLLFYPPLLSVLRDLLGHDFVVLRESAAHLNHFAPWHKDTRAQEAAGHRFHWEPDYLMVEAGFYLQANSVEWGGGLDVQPGTHREPDRSLETPSLIDRALRRLRRAAGMREERSFVSLQSQPGDLVLFDFRLDHRGSVPRCPADEAHDKMAIFIGCSTKSRHVEAYQAFIRSRPDYEYLSDGAYPEDLLAQARAAGVTLA